MTTREVPTEILTALDSHLSWCRHRHRNPDDVKPEMDKLIVYLRRPEPQSEGERTNRIMRDVLEGHLATLRAEATREGWL